MATVINNPPTVSTSESSNAGTIIAIIIAALLVLAFIVYGLPALQNQGSSNTVPEQVDININRDINR